MGPTLWGRPAIFKPGPGALDLCKSKDASQADEAPLRLEVELEFSGTFPGGHGALDFQASVSAEVSFGVAHPTFAGLVIIPAPLDPGSRPVFWDGIFASAPAVVFEFSHGEFL